jgi:hypothetical protein
MRIIIVEIGQIFSVISRLTAPESPIIPMNVTFIKDPDLLIKVKKLP